MRTPASAKNGRLGILFGLLINGSTTFATFSLLAKYDASGKLTPALASNWFLLYTFVAVFAVPSERIIAREIAARNRPIQTIWPYASKALRQAFLPIFFFSVLNASVFQARGSFPFFLLFTLIASANLSLFHFFRGALSGSNLGNKFSIMIGLEGLGRLLIALSLVIIQPDVKTGISLVITVPTMLGLTYGMFAYRRHSSDWQIDEPPKDLLHRGQLNPSYRSIYFLALSAVASGIITNGGPSLLSLISESQSEFLSLSYLLLIFRAPFFLLQAVQIDLIPKFSRGQQGARSEIRRLLRENTLQMGLISSAALLSSFAIGPILSEIFFNQEISGIEFVIVASTFTTQAIASPVISLLISLKKEPTLAIGSLIGTAVILLIMVTAPFEGLRLVTTAISLGSLAQCSFLMLMLRFIARADSLEN